MVEKNQLCSNTGVINSFWCFSNKIQTRNHKKRRSSERGTCGKDRLGSDHNHDWLLVQLCQHWVSWSTKNLYLPPTDGSSPPAHHHSQSQQWSRGISLLQSLWLQDLSVSRRLFSVHLHASWSGVQTTHVPPVHIAPRRVELSTDSPCSDNIFLCSCKQFYWETHLHIV